jgi:hypothetical protein
MKTLKRIVDTLKTRFSGKAGLPRVLLLTLVALAVFALPSASHAAASCDTLNIPCYVAALFVKIFELLTALMGFILIMEVDALIRVAQYANFVSPGPTAVQIGWVVTRDLANMFFIVFLLIIAFSTIIGYEKYAYRNNLRRLLIMAVVINFSKTICGIFIDMSQVLMLTFVNGFKEAAAGNFLAAFQIQKLLDLSKDTVAQPDFGLVLAMMLAFVLAAIAASVVLVLLVMLTFRIVMLWILIILSPIAFLTSSFPIGTNYYAQWWSELKKYLTSGPVIAFFLWLALASAQACPNGLGEPSTSTNPNQPTCKNSGFAGQSTAAAAESQGSQSFQTYSIPTEAGKADTILSLVIVTCILFAGLKFASESGVAGAGFAKQVRSKAEAYAKRAITAPVNLAGGIAKDQVGGALQSVGGRAMSRVGAGLARVPIVGGLGRRMAATGEKLEEGRRQELEKRWAGSAKDLAKYSPGQFGSAMRVRTATDGQIKETAEAAIGNPKALAALQASGAADTVRDRLKRLADKDPSQKGAYDNFMKANWTGAKDPKEQAAILQKFTGEDAKKFMKAGDLNEASVSQLPKGALTELLASGKDDQKAAVLGAFGDKNANGELEGFMKEKRLTYADIPAEAYAQAGVSGKGLKMGALAAAEKDPSLMKKFADDPKMRDVLAPVAKENMASAVTSFGKAQKLAALSTLGGATDADFADAEVEKSLGQLSIKQLNDMERNTPTDSPAAQASLERVITSALKNGSTELAQAIMRSPTLSQRAPLTVAREAEKSTSGYTRSLDSTASSKIADLERQSKKAKDEGDSFGAVGFTAAAKEIRDFTTKVKEASKELASAEEGITRLREEFSQEQKNAQKTGDTTQLKALGEQIAAVMENVENKKKGLAAANDALKAKV